MGLTSKKLLVAVVILAVALFVLTIWLWPRLAKRGVSPSPAGWGCCSAGS